MLLPGSKPDDAEAQGILASNAFPGALGPFVHPGRIERPAESFEVSLVFREGGHAPLNVV